ncbi:hypothetical protein BJ138DRAFT_1171030 [Hygrophoropsis aurantiaca]|uniref:Uncharacterized protein n=1 Tax=Hygrophoropsis aurantiaca TaxID=72124 RepID=A0ACB8AM69_9AGAM|nr:hypothetical protein BJ138DRAFT_1171030 [Hygrophoropsis aurantiaca]
MGFLKKFFSIGSKKSKKRALGLHSSDTVPPIPELLKPCREEDTEAAVSRLLRSSSARFAVGSELDYASLPPMPHPINHIIPPPTVSSATLGSVSQKSTYTVTIHGRTVHSRTEFPNAYPSMDDLRTPKRPTKASSNDSARRRSKSVPITPREQNRLLRLRQDPSVASLLNVYDDHGCLDSRVFSNTPPSPEREKDGRIQRRRTGSTLRQLLGHPSSPDVRNRSLSEGDISWAEKFLDETDGASSASSTELKTPTDPPFIDVHLSNADNSCAIVTDCDTSSMLNHRTFSSLEVELSISTDTSHHQISEHTNSPYISENPMTPQRASQIFGFLTDKKKASVAPPEDQPLYKLSSSTAPIRTTPDVPDIPPNSDTLTFSVPQSTRQDLELPRPDLPMNETLVSHATGANAHTITVHAGPSMLPVIVTNHTGQSIRAPRGPRALSKTPSVKIPDSNEGRMSSEGSQKNHIGEQSQKPYPRPSLTMSNSTDIVPPLPTNRFTKSNDVFTLLPTRPSIRRSSSRSSATSSLHPSISAPALHKHRMKPVPPIESNTPPQDKENERVSQLPKTPKHLPGHRYLSLREQPSPASSSELSPVAQQLMANLRQQRMQARQRERQTGRWGSGQSRIRY